MNISETLNILTASITNCILLQMSFVKLLKLLFVIDMVYCNELCTINGLYIVFIVLSVSYNCIFCVFVFSFEIVIDLLYVKLLLLPKISIFTFLLLLSI